MIDEFIQYLINQSCCNMNCVLLFFLVHRCCTRLHTFHYIFEQPFQCKRINTYADFYLTFICLRFVCAPIAQRDTQTCVSDIKNNNNVNEK